MLQAVAFSSKTLVLIPILLSPRVIVSMLQPTEKAVNKHLKHFKAQKKHGSEGTLKDIAAVQEEKKSI